MTRQVTGQDARAESTLPGQPTPKVRLGLLLLAGLLLALVMAGVASSFASSDPDGLDSALLVGCTVDADGQIVGGKCPAQNAADSATADSPLADYSVGARDSAWSTGLSGVAGVLVTMAVGWALFALLRRREPAVDGG